MLYIVHNHNTNELLTLTEEQLETYFPELKDSTMEIVDEIDPNYQEPVCN